MPFLKRSCPITRFRPVGQEIDRATLQQATEHLARNGFRSIDTLPDEESYGWVNMDDPTDNQWTASAPERLAHLAWTFRMDKRSVPGKLLEVRTRQEVKKFLERKREEVMKKVLIPFASKDEKAQVRDRVRLSLLSQTAPVPSLADVVWTTPGTGEIWVCSTTVRHLELFRRLFELTFTCSINPVVPFTPILPGENCPLTVGQDFLTWLYSHDGDTLDVSGKDVEVVFERVVVADSEKSLTLTATGESNEVTEALARNHRVVEATILMTIEGGEYHVRVRGETFAMRVDTTFWTSDREDPDGSFADKHLSLERLFATWDTLYLTWLRDKGLLPKDKAPRKAKPTRRPLPVADDTTTDPTYSQALEFARAQGTASISGLQRHFRIGFNKAARLIEQMERDDVFADGCVRKTGGGRLGVAAAENTVSLALALRADGVRSVEKGADGDSVVMHYANGTTVTMSRKKGKNEAGAVITSRSKPDVTVSIGTPKESA